MDLIPEKVTYSQIQWTKVTKQPVSAGPFSMGVALFLRPPDGPEDGWECFPTRHLRPDTVQVIMVIRI